MEEDLANLFCDAIHLADGYVKFSDGPLSTQNLQSRDLLQTILASRHAKCRDARDRGFALGGLTARDPLTSENDPDYSLSCVEVYEKLASTYIDCKKSLNILHYCNSVEVPTWVPRWDEPMLEPLIREYINSAFPVYNAAGETKPEYIHKKPGVLTLTGFQVTSVKQSHELEGLDIHPDLILKGWQYLDPERDICLARFCTTLTAQLSNSGEHMSLTEVKSLEKAVQAHSRKLANFYPDITWNLKSCQLLSYHSKSGGICESTAKIDTYV